jgi:hypothetical protein
MQFISGSLEFLVTNTGVFLSFFFFFAKLSLYTPILHEAYIKFYHVPLCTKDCYKYETQMSLRFTTSIYNEICKIT